MVNQLQELLRQYVANQRSYADFRAAFVDEFLSMHYDDVVLDDIVNEIESDCADFDEGDIAEDELRGVLKIIAMSPIVSIEWQNDGGVSKVNLPVSRVPLARENWSSNPAISVFEQEPAA